MERALLAARIYELCHLQGTFVLRSGETVSGYFDKYQFESQPSLLRDVARYLCEAVPPSTEVLAAPELGGIPLGTALSLETGLPLVFVHREPKRFATCRRVEGISVAGRNVLIVDDLVSTGTQVVDVGRAITQLDGRVLGVVCVIDREHGGSRLIRAAGWTFAALFSETELQPV